MITTKWCLLLSGHDLDAQSHSSPVPRGPKWPFGKSGVYQKSFCRLLLRWKVSCIQGSIIYADFCGLKTQAKRAVMSNSGHSKSILQTDF